MNFSKHKLAFCVAASMIGASASSYGATTEKNKDVAEQDTITIVGEGSGQTEMMNLEAEASVSKTGAPVKELPYSVSIINEQFMQDIGAKNIQDAMLYTSGVYSGAFGFDTRGDWSKVRGVAPIDYIDGMKSIFGYYNNVRPNVYTLDSIEILKGPASMLFGQSSVGGIQNAVTKRPEKEEQGEVWFQLGNHDRKQIAGDYTGKLDKEGQFLYRVIGLARDSDTQVDYVEDDEYLFNGSLAWVPNDDTKLTFIVNRQINEGQVSAQFLPSGGTLESHPLGQIPTRRFVGEPDWDKFDREQTAFTAILEHQFNDDWGVSLGTRYTDASSETREHWANIGTDPTPSGEIGRTVYMIDKSSEAFTFDARVQGDIDWGITNHKLTFGVDHQDVELEEWNYHYGSAAGTFNVYDPVYGVNVPNGLATSDQPDSETTQLGVYIADHIRIDNVIVSAALRRDRTKSQAEGSDAARAQATTGHLGLMYEFENGFSPYVSYSESFAPNTGTDGTGGVLDPTEGEQVEWGIKYSSPGNDLSMTFAHFDIEQKDRVSDGSTPGGLQQTGAEIDGWEVQLQKRWDQLNVLFNLSKIDAIDPNDGNAVPLSSVADKLASVWGAYDFLNGWRVGAGARYTGEVYGSGGGPRVSSVTQYDAMVGYRFGDWDFTFNVQNLTDEEYVSWCRSAGNDCGYGERRTAMLNARYNF